MHQFPLTASSEAQVTVLVPRQRAVVAPSVRQKLAMFSYAQLQLTLPAVTVISHATPTTNNLVFSLSLTGNRVALVRLASRVCS